MGGMPINMKELGITPTDEQIPDLEIYIMEFYPANIGALPFG